MMNPVPWGLLAAIALGAEMVWATLAFTYTRRLRRLPTRPLSDAINGYQEACRKVRNKEPLTQDEFDLAAQIIDIRRHPLAYTVPAAFMTIGAFYILGSMEYLHGAHPSERTFLGAIPMITSTNLIIQMRKTARLRKRLSKVTIADAGPTASTRDSRSEFEVDPLTVEHELRARSESRAELE